MTPKKKEAKSEKIPKKANPKTSESTKKAKSSKKSEVSMKTESKLKVSQSKPKSPKNTPKSAPKSPKSTPKSAPKSPKKTPKSAPKSPKKTPKSAPKSPKKTPSSKPTNIPKKAKTNSKVTKSKPVKKSGISLRRKILKKKSLRIGKKYQIKSIRGVVYLKNIPHGFYEIEMKSFFSQFGQVTGVKIPRSKRTGKYKGYAFVEFLYPDVAKIAAETMNGYLMYKRLIKAKYLPPEEQKSYAFKFPAFKVPLVERRKRYLRQRSNRILTDKENEKEKKRVETCVQKKLKKLKKLNIDYQFQVANPIA